MNAVIKINNKKYFNAIICFYFFRLKYYYQCLNIKKFKYGLKRAIFKFFS